MRDSGVFDNHVRSLFLCLGDFPFVLQRSLWQMFGKLALADTRSEADCAIEEFADFVRTSSQENLKCWFDSVSEARHRSLKG